MKHILYSLRDLERRRFSNTHEVKRGGEWFGPNEAPAWNILVSEDMDADAFVEAIIDMDRIEFWRLAEEAGIRVDLLKEVGYEYNYHTFDTGLDAVNFIKENFVDWRNSNKAHELMLKIDKSTSPDEYISDLIRRVLGDHWYCSGDEYPSIEDVFKKEHDENMIRGLVMHEVAQFFIEEFQDSKTPLRRELFKLYGPCLLALREFESFYSNGGFRMIQRLHGAQKEADRYQGLYQLVSIYRLVGKKGCFSMQSDVMKNERVDINHSCAESLNYMIADHLSDVWNAMLYDSFSAKTKLSNKFMKSFYKKLPDTIYDWKDSDFDSSEREEYRLDKLSKWLKGKEKIYNDLISYEMFYYGAFSIIEWPDNYTWTDKCIFLYRLAHLCGFDKVSESKDLSDCFARKEITDRIKRLINKAINYDSDKIYLNLMLEPF